MYGGATSSESFLAMGMVRGSCRILTCKFKELSRNNQRLKLKFLKSSGCENAQEAQNTENELFLGISRVLLYDFLQTYFWIFL